MSKEFLLIGTKSEHWAKTDSEMGIIVERRSGSNGEYSIAPYNIEAQKFIIDNLLAIVRII